MAVQRSQFPRGGPIGGYPPLVYTAPEEPPDPWATVGAGAGQAMSQTPFGGWNAQNIFDEDYWNQVNEQAKAGAFTQSRDEISLARDAFLQPYEQQFHALAAEQGAQAEGSTGLLAQDPRFRAFVQQGTRPTFQTPTQQWLAAPTPPPMAPTTPTATLGVPGLTSPAPTPTLSPLPPTTPGAAATPANEFVRLLMERAQRGPVDRRDADVRAQADAYGAQQTRASRNYLSDLAEREGGAPVNLRGEERMAAERAGQASGAFEAEIIGRLNAQRRDELLQYMQMWGNQLSNDQRVSIERELANLTDRARTADRSQNMDQFLRELALREWDIGQGWDYRWSGM